MEEQVSEITYKIIPIGLYNLLVLFLNIKNQSKTQDTTNVVTFDLGLIFPIS
jgi:hypothetical protein